MNKKFKMEKVLEIREKALEREKIKLAELQQIEADIRAELQVIAQEINKSADEMEQDKAQGRFEFVEMFTKFIKIKQQELIEFETRRQAAEKNIVKQKELLRKALNDVKVMEKLKEKHLIEYQAYVKKQEDMQIDEINISRGFKED